MEYGTVIWVSRNGQWLKVSCPPTTYLVELLGSEGLIEVGDRLLGDWVGSDPIVYRDGEEFSVVIQDHT